jgi:hypothetical protein
MEDLATLLIREWTAESYGGSAGLSQSQSCGTAGPAAGPSAMSQSISLSVSVERGERQGEGILWDGQLAVLREMRAVLSANPTSSLKSSVIHRLKSDRVIFQSDLQFAEIEGKLGAIVR